MGIQITIDAADALDARFQMGVLLRGAMPETPARALGAATGPSLESQMAAVDGDLVGENRDEPNRPAEQEAPAAEEAPKRKRRTKAEIAADLAAEQAQEEAPAQAISASPEDRRDPDEADEPDVEDAEEADEDDEADDGDDDLVGGFAVTSEGLVAAMQAHVAKFGLEQTEKHGPALFGNGYVKRRDVVEAGEEAIKAALRRFVGAIQSGKAGG